MNETTKDRSLLIRNGAILGDFALLNVLMLLVSGLLPADKLEPSTDPLRTYLVLANLCYIPAIYSFNVILHYRIVRPEQIVARVVASVTFHTCLFLTVISVLKMDYLSRTFLVVFYTSFFIAVLSWRLSLRIAVKKYRKLGKNIRCVLLIGGGESMDELFQTMSDETYGYRVLDRFFIYNNLIDSSDPCFQKEMHRLWDFLGTYQVKEIYCGLPFSCQKEILALIRYSENNMIRFYNVPNLRNFVKRQFQLSLLNDVPVLSIRKEPLQDSTNRFIKRLFDLFCSTIFLVTIFPILYLIVGVIVKITSPGPIFFKQSRTGLDGKEFLCYKFRSMRMNKDADTIQATKDDPRKTKFGNFLRKSNLDEMPQFINVFKGEMSIVGPRPHMLKHTDEYSKLIDKYMMRHLVKPGITGWAQVTGFRGETKELSQMEGRVKRDIWYIENWTFFLDLRIILKTVTNMLDGEKNAY